MKNMMVMMLMEKQWVRMSKRTVATVGSIQIGVRQSRDTLGRCMKPQLTSSSASDCHNFFLLDLDRVTHEKHE